MMLLGQLRNPLRQCCLRFVALSRTEIFNHLDLSEVLSINVHFWCELSQIDSD